MLHIDVEPLLYNCTKIKYKNKYFYWSVEQVYKLCGFTQRLCTRQSGEKEVSLLAFENVPKIAFTLFEKKDDLFKFDRLSFAVC